MRSIRDAADRERRSRSGWKVAEYARPDPALVALLRQAIHGTDTDPTKEED